MTDELKQIQENIELFGVLLEKLVSPPLKIQIEKMMEGIGELYFTAPASSKKKYHYSFPGGLVAHSFNVFKNLKKLTKEFGGNFSDETIFVVSMFHDLGKACNTDLTTPHYTPKDNEYEYNEKGVFLDTHTRSLFILHHFGVQLTAEEYQAIQLNDGMYIDANTPYMQKETLLSLLLHMADRLACFQEKEENLTI